MIKMTKVEKLKETMKHGVCVNKNGYLLANIVWKMYLLLNVVYYLYFWIGYVRYIIMTPEDVSGGLVVHFLFGKTNSLISMVLIMLREKKLKNVLSVIISTLKMQARHRYSSLKRTYQIVAVLITIYLSALCTMSALSGLCSNGRIYSLNSLKVICMGCDPLKWSTTALNAMIVLDAISYVFFSLGQFLIFCVFYTFFTSGLNHLAEIINDQLRRMHDDEKTLKESLPTVRQRVDVLRDLVEQTNDSLQIGYMIWYVGSLVFACLGLTRIISHWGRPDTKPWVLTYEILDNFQCTFLVIVGTLMGSRIPATIEKGLPLVHKITENAVKLKMTDQIQMLFTQISNPAIAMSVGGCTIVTKQLLISYLGLLVTYVVVYIQMSPELLQKLQNLRQNVVTNETLIP